jgi:alpha-tubulin suppressor-like RCC1 family protein
LSGYRHTLAVTTNGGLYAWGGNSFGQLGQNNIVDRSSPIQVGALTNWAQVSAGNFFTVAVTTGNELYAWGRNINGQLGQNNIVDRSSPVQVGALTNWAQVDTGSDFTASVKVDGTLWAWGNNTNGQLGDGTVVFKSSPVQIGALTNWTHVSAGGNGTSGALTSAGELYAWGRNNDGQLGLNDTVSRSSPIQIGALTNWSHVSVGGVNVAAILKGT